MLWAIQKNKGGRTPMKMPDYLVAKDIAPVWVVENCTTITVPKGTVLQIEDWDKSEYGEAFSGRILFTHNSTGLEVMIDTRADWEQLWAPVFKEEVKKNAQEER
jgi:hypothetical protein